MGIEVQNISKIYRIHRKDEGFVGSVKSLFHRKYEEKIAVNDLSFSIEEGAFVGFIGPNGAGKTTTLKMLAGILTPSSGKATVCGNVPYERNKKHRSQISMVMGNRSQLVWDLPPLESFRLYQAMYRIPPHHFNKDLKYLSELLGVEDLLKVQTRKLSLGERMKMELIGSLLHRPRVLFLDEPTIGLDLFAQRSIRQFLKNYNKKYEATILLTSHYLEDIEELCDRLIVIDQGKSLYDGLTKQIVKQLSSHKYITFSFKDESSVAMDQTDYFARIDPKDITKIDSKIVIRVERKDAPRIASEILALYPIEDLTIEDLTIDEIIENLYTSSHSHMGVT